MYGIETVSLRYFNVYGERQPTEGAYCLVMGIFAGQLLEGKPMTINGDGEQRRDFTHVDDIVDGLIRCAWVLGAKTFELGRGKNYSINEIADAFGDYPTEYIEEKPGEMRNTLNTDTRARDMLDWNPTGDIIEYIKNNILRK